VQIEFFASGQPESRKIPLEMQIEFFASGQPESRKILFEKQMEFSLPGKKKPVLLERAQYNLPGS
jgi:hypothetical protein